MYGLPGHWYGALEWQYPPHQRQGSYEEEGRAVNTMKVWAWHLHPYSLFQPRCRAAWMQPVLLCTEIMVAVICCRFLARLSVSHISCFPLAHDVYGVGQGGISTADRIVTVSPGYAWEIQTPEGGWGMEQMLGSRAYALNGVLNGIDNHDWNPQHDKHLVQKYSVSNFSRGKVGMPLRWVIGLGCSLFLL